MIRFSDEASHDGKRPRPEGPDSAPGRLDELADEIAELSARIYAAQYRLLVRLREFDALFEREGGLWGFQSSAHWLSWRTSLSPGAARERVRVARALGDLPRISEAMEEGRLSYSKVRALTRVATPETEEELLAFALEATAAQLEKVVRSWRRLERLEAVDREEGRYALRELDLRPGEDGMWEVRGRLEPEVGEVVRKALELASEALFRRAGAEGASEGRRGGANGAARPSAAERRADALELVAETVLRVGVGGEGASGSEEAAGDVPAETSAQVAGETPARVPAETPTEPAKIPANGEARGPSPRVVARGDRYQVVVHLDARELAKPGTRMPAGVGEARVPVSAETARRLACDAGRVEMIHDGEGRVLDVGRRSRTVPVAMRRALEERDGGCRFPGCGLRFVDAHHLVHWSAGGETKLENLVLLCRRHHRAVHEGGVGVERTEEGEIRFRRPDGRVLPHVPELPRIGAVEGEWGRVEGAPDPRTGDPLTPFRGAFRTGEPGPLSHAIGPWTATPGWNGEAWDLQRVLSFLAWTRRTEADEGGGSGGHRNGRRSGVPEAG